ncbi:hypothetical protein [Salinisphaera aquimarina]|uniref:Uncharacterized protein n=1 Tax=Salinisphaera aquimarina TaxID=2094031 RepID=A0ABV7ESV9_9GAMM
MTGIPGSEQTLGGEAISACAQLSVNPAGHTLAVTERFAPPAALSQQTSDNERLDDEGVIVTIAIKRPPARIRIAIPSPWAPAVSRSAATAPIGIS